MIYGSKWDGLSEHLIASFYEVQKEGVNTFRWIKKEGTDVVRAPLTDASMQIELNWNDPFEDSGMDSKAPALMSLLQNGGIQANSDSFIGNGGVNQELTQYLTKFEGRTGITKLNSTQIFVSMKSFRINCTAHFRAWNDGKEEVENPVNRLMQWALPQKLSEDGPLASRGMDKAKGEIPMEEMLMPSLCPKILAMQYKGRTYAPVVIESIDYQMDSPINEKGDFTQMPVQLTICSLMAIDKDDWEESKKTVIL